MRSLLCTALFLAFVAPAAAQDPRLNPPKTYNGFFPWAPPAKLQDWEKRRQEMREQVLVANGLWPMWDKNKLEPVIHGKIERDGYTIEKVYFASLPGHYVTGNLYRPTGVKGKAPGVLCPHGHWANGRFFEASDKAVAAELKSGAEKTAEGARYPLQARCAMLARLGCVVFHYDMLGYADSATKSIAHRAGFPGPEPELYLHNVMGLQTFNSIRALDFIMSLPDVDTSRIGVTGASGGGTQTFILCGIDDRPAAAFPAVMVSTGMQGGCICENASYLRIGTSNIELAGLFAPKPLGMSAANDWTKEIMTKGLPELKSLYKLYGKESDVEAQAWLEFGHNYNQVAREMMYNFFNKHLKLGHSGVIHEKPFVPVKPVDLTVFDEKHPRPKDEANAERLTATLKEMHTKQLEALFPADEAAFERMDKVLAPALRVMIDPGAWTPPASGLPGDFKAVGAVDMTLSLQHAVKGEAVPARYIRGKEFDGRVVVWVHPDGLASLYRDGKPGGKLVAEAEEILKKNAAILAVEVLRTGATATAKEHPVNKGFAGYTFGYNRPLLAERVRDIRLAIASAAALPDVKQVHLVGWEKAGPWVALARAGMGDKVARTAADLNGFHFGSIKSYDDENMLPGGLRYGGLLTLASLSAPAPLYLHNAESCGSMRWIEAAYKAAGQPGNLTVQPRPATNVVEWLLK